MSLAAGEGRNQDDLNVTEPSFYAEQDPETILQRWRRDDPVHWTLGRYDRGFWSVTRMADCRAPTSATSCSTAAGRADAADQPRLCQSG